jgi:hypothetical protein
MVKSKISNSTGELKTKVLQLKLEKKARGITTFRHSLELSSEFELVRAKKDERQANRLIAQEDAVAQVRAPPPAQEDDASESLGSVDSDDEEDEDEDGYYSFDEGSQSDEGTGILPARGKLSYVFNNRKVPLSDGSLSYAYYTAHGEDKFLFWVKKSVGSERNVNVRVFAYVPPFRVSSLYRW